MAVHLAHRLTNLMCRRCQPPFSCCTSAYCNGALFQARANFGRFDDIDPPAEGHILADERGCQIPPEYRVNCSLHVCPETVERFATSDWKKAYRIINILVHELMAYTGRAPRAGRSASPSPKLLKRRPPPRFLTARCFIWIESVVRRLEAEI